MMMMMVVVVKVRYFFFFLGTVVDGCEKVFFFSFFLRFFFSFLFLGEKDRLKKRENVRVSFRSCFGWSLPE